MGRHTGTNAAVQDEFPALPGSWSELTWQQLADCWRVKTRYGTRRGAARVAALLSLLGLTPLRRPAGSAPRYDGRSGEPVYVLSDGRGGLWSVTPREASQMALRALPWFDWPYGDPGDPAVKDEKGVVVKEAREPVRGYVSSMHDALILPQEEIVVRRRHFALPQVACNNLTWQQYRSLQAVVPQLFQEGIGDDDALDLQARFLAHCLVPRSLALLDTTGGSIRFRPHYSYQYDSLRAEQTVKLWKKHLSSSTHGGAVDGPTLFNVCFQAYQTAVAYYAAVYPLLFGDDKKDAMRDALQGEVATVNTIMKYAGYAEQQQVYDSNLPFVLDILNTMAKEAKEIESMNSKIRKK